MQATSLNAEGLSTYIIETLNRFGLDPACIVSQGYDGASVMRGRCSGVQQRIKEIAPQAVYVHCYAHCLNLALVDTTRIVREASEFFALMEKLYVFVSSSKSHEVFLEKQKQLHPFKQVRRLQKLSDTRWACRYMAVDAVCCTYDSLLATLEVITDWEDREKAVQANGILLQVRNFRFLLLLVIFDRILSFTKGLSDELQSKSIDMAKAADLVGATVDVLRSFRTDSEWQHILQYVKDASSLYNICAENSESERSRQPPKRYECGLIMETTGSRSRVMTDEQRQISIFFPILDAIVAELDRRFSSSNLEHIRAIAACSFQSPNFLESQKLQMLAESYGLDTNLLSTECMLAKRTLLKKDMECIGDVLSQLFPHRMAFPLVVKLLQIALTTAVSTAHCERSLKRIKCYLRSTMTEQRLADLAVLSIERAFKYVILRRSSR